MCDSDAPRNALLDDRGQRCFFLTYVEDVGLEAGEEIRLIEAERAQLARDRRLRVWGIVATCASALLGALLGALLSRCRQ